MDEKEEPTQQTEKDLEIPIPKRSAWDRLLKKVAQPKPADDEESK